MTDKYATLRAALNAGPTPGPWSVYICHGVIQIDAGDTAAGRRPCIVFWTGFDENDLTLTANTKNSSYIAAANPNTVHDLLADHDQWRQQAQYETDVAQAACERVKEVEADRDRLRDAVQETVRILQSNNSAITDTVWVTGSISETLLDRCLNALAQEGS